MTPLLHPFLVNDRFGGPALLVDFKLEMPFHFSPRYAGPEPQLRREVQEAFKRTPP